VAREPEKNLSQPCSWWGGASSPEPALALWEDEGAMLVLCIRRNVLSSQIKSPERE